MQRSKGGGEIVNSDLDGSIRKEGVNPISELQQVALGPEDMDHPIMMDVIKETLDVNHQERQNETLVACCLDVMGEGEACVKVQGIGTSTELIEWEEIIFSDVENEVFGNYLLPQFAQTFDQLDGMV